MRLQMAALLFSAIAFSATDKKVAPVRAGNDEVDITGKAILTREDATQALGMDPGMDIVMVEIRVKPKSDAKIALSRDDFTMISRRDGQKTQAMHPSQIAGSGVMIVSSSGSRIERRHGRTAARTDLGRNAGNRRQAAANGGRQRRLDRFGSGDACGDR